MRIGVTDCFNEDKYQQYVDWTHATDAGVEIVRLAWTEQNADAVGSLDGLVLTGGGDVHPRFSGMDGSLDGLAGVDERRDEFELDVIDRALTAERPVLGVCRGMQIMNVALGGTLVRDLEAAGYRNHRSVPEQKTEHGISVIPHTLLQTLAGVPVVRVNSSHHQAVDELGRGLMRAAVSEEGVTEAAEWALKDRMPFLLLVQWHPERTPDHPLSRNIVSLFLREVQMTHEQHTDTTY